MPNSSQRSLLSQRNRRRKAARPGEIVAAALELFVARGFAATRLDDVAKQAGIAKGTLYLYFESKEALFQAVVQEMVIPEVERSEGLAVDFPGSRSELLRKLVLSWWQSLSSGPICGIPKLMVAEATNFPELSRFFIEKVVSRVRRNFARVIRQGIEQGEFRACDPEAVTRLLISPMVLLAIWRHSLMPFDQPPPLEDEDYLKLHLEMFLRGLAANG